MANFKEAYDRTVGHEGGYVNDPDDNGGETYKGISRKSHPDSPMWILIDDVKKEHGTKNINGILNYNNRIQHLIESIYKNDYWDVFRLDECFSQKIANEIFDDAVNRGVSAACVLASATLGMTTVNKPTDSLINNLKNYGRS